MDPNILPMYCLADELYFDAPDRIKDMATRYHLGTCDVRKGWERTSMHMWTTMEPAGNELPHQGWKIHVPTW